MTAFLSPFILSAQCDSLLRVVFYPEANSQLPPFVFKDNLYFTFNKGDASGPDLYKWIEADSIQLVPNNLPHTQSSAAHFPTLFNDRAYLFGIHPTDVRIILYALDEDSLKIAFDGDVDIFAGGLSYAWRDRLLFQAGESQYGEELYSIDRDNNVSLLYDIDPGSESSRPGSFTLAHDRLYFKVGGEDRRDQRAYYIFNDQLVRYPPLDSTTLMGAFGDDLIIAADRHNGLGRELYKYNGVEFTLIQDMIPGASSGLYSRYTYFPMTHFNNGKRPDVLFSVRRGFGFRLEYYRYDGTSVIPMITESMAPSFYDNGGSFWVEFRGDLFFMGHSSGGALYKIPCYFNEFQPTVPTLSQWAATILLLSMLIISTIGLRQLSYCP